MSQNFARPSLEEVFHKYRDFVFRTCFRYFKNTRDAEDLTQEVFLKLYKKLPDFRGDSALTTWIYRIATNTCIDHLRTRKEYVSYDEFKIDENEMPNFSSHSDASLAKIDLEKILEQVNPETREILFLTLAEGCTYDEAAEVVGISKSAIAKIVVRFQKKIQINKRAWIPELFNRKGASE